MTTEKTTLLKDSHWIRSRQASEIVHLALKRAQNELSKTDIDRMSNNARELLLASLVVDLTTSFSGAHALRTLPEWINPMKKESAQ